MSVDLPTPEGPISTAVDRGGSRSRRVSSPSPVTALTATTSTPGAARCASNSASSTSGHRSTLLSTTSGSAPPSNTRVTSLSSARIPALRSRPHTRATVSTLAASTWACAARPAARRVREVRRSVPPLFAHSLSHSHRRVGRRDESAIFLGITRNIAESLLDSAGVFRCRDRMIRIEANASPGSRKRSDRLFWWAKKKRSFTISMRMM